MTNVNPFIVIEGNDATGKASVASFLGESLAAEVISFPRYASTSGHAVLSNLQGHWRCDVSEALFVAANSSDSTAADAAAYMAVARPHGMPLGAVVRQAIMTANRCEAHKALLAALARGMVVGDRYTLSSLVYGVAEGLTPEYITNLSAPLLVPDLTIVLDMPPELTSVRRPQARDANELNLPLLRATRKGYRAAAGLWLEEQAAPFQLTLELAKQLLGQPCIGQPVAEAANGGRVGEAAVTGLEASKHHEVQAHLQRMLQLRVRQTMPLPQQHHSTHHL